MHSEAEECLCNCGVAALERYTNCNLAKVASLFNHNSVSILFIIRNVGITVWLLCIIYQCDVFCQGSNQITPCPPLSLSITLVILEDVLYNHVASSPKKWSGMAMLGCWEFSGKIERTQEFEDNLNMERGSCNFLWTKVFQSESRWRGIL